MAIYKKKAAIISSYAYIRGHNNYGSIFQYYALQQYLKKFDVDSCWIRYMFPVWSMYKDLIKKTVNSLLYGFRLKNIWNHMKTQIAFRKFMYDKCNLSERKYDSIDKLKQNPPEADVYITGSDQVWGGWLEANYLTFVPNGKKKIAYAASFGKRQLTEEHLFHVQAWVQGFDAVSVREMSGVDICHSMGVKAQCLLDPTLLIDEVDYLPVGVERLEKGRYVFCYFINERNFDNFRLEDIIAYSKRQNAILKITGIEGPEMIIPLRYLYQYSPEAWLNHYKYAECIFTNTFHGIVFCIISQKQFCVLLQKGVAAKQNERIYSILKLFELEDRILDSNKSIENIIAKPINWDNIEKIKEKWRLKTDAFFHEYLNI